MTDMLDKFTHIAAEVVFAFHLRVDDLVTTLVFGIVDDDCHGLNYSVKEFFIIIVCLRRSYIIIAVGIHAYIFYLTPAPHEFTT